MNRLQRLGVYTLRHVVLIFMILVVAVGLYKAIPCLPTKRIVVENKKIWVCVANTEAEQIRGLSGSHYLPRGWGMLFVFEDYSHHKFWMKDMNYAIDILWLTDDYQPREVARNAKPDSYPGVFTPVYANRFILETRPSVVGSHFPAVRSVNKNIDK